MSSENTTKDNEKESNDELFLPGITQIISHYQKDKVSSDTLEALWDLLKEKGFVESDFEVLHPNKTTWQRHADSFSKYSKLQDTNLKFFYKLVCAYFRFSTVPDIGKPTVIDSVNSSSAKDIETEATDLLRLDLDKLYTHEFLGFTINRSLLNLGLVLETTETLEIEANDRIPADVARKLLLHIILKGPTEPVLEGSSEKDPELLDVSFREIEENVGAKQPDGLRAHLKYLSTVKFLRDGQVPSKIFYMLMWIYVQLQGEKSFENIISEALEMEADEVKKSQSFPHSLDVIGLELEESLKKLQQYIGEEPQVPENESNVSSASVPTGGPLLQTKSFSKVFEHLKSKPESKEILFDKSVLERIHAAFHRTSNRFVLLSGLSGTGKTQLMIRYMKAYLELLELDVEDHFKLVAVTPAFRDPTPLLGYYNSLHPDKPYVPGELTELLIAADKNPGKPYFLIMDEMNLARVEYYFAPLLSAMESDNGIVFHHQAEPVSTVPSMAELKNNDPLMEKPALVVPSKLSGWPKNIFLCGTVNMDETTHAFSDKVLDRAFTFEFWDVNLSGYFERNPAPTKVREVLQEFYDELRKVNLHFGYRTLRAVCDFVMEPIPLPDAENELCSNRYRLFENGIPKNYFFKVEKNNGDVNFFLPSYRRKIPTTNERVDDIPENFKLFLSRLKECSCSITQIQFHFKKKWHEVTLDYSKIFRELVEEDIWDEVREAAKKFTKTQAYKPYQITIKTTDWNIDLLCNKISMGVDYNTTFLDQAIFSKVLPKIRGQHSDQLVAALAECIEICEKHQLTECGKKLEQMQQRLNINRLTRFWS